MNSNQVLEQTKTKIQAATGHFKQDNRPVDLKSVIRVIDAARDEEEARLIRIAEAGATGLR